MSEPAAGIRLSVVIAAHDAASVIEPCLEALTRHADPASMEVIVADSSADGTEEIIGRGFPGVRVLHFDEPLGVPQLRGRGLALARGAIIAILDPFSIVDDHWIDEVLRAHAAFPNLVIGGTVDLFRPETRSLADWAIYINEYGMFMPPAPGGEVSILAGSNVSYKQSCLFDEGRLRQPVFWKTFANWAAEAQGSPLRLEPRIRVSLNKPLPFAEFFRTRAWHGRCFAGLRVAQAGWGSRCLRAGSTPFLPALLCLRWARAFWPKRRRRGMFLLTLPIQLALFMAWSWGELQGYLRGPGATCQKLNY